MTGTMMTGMRTGSGMDEKTAPLGICDLCGEEIHLALYTSKRKPRRYCSRECRNTANSRAGSPARSRKAKERVQAGQWQNPSPLVREDATPEELEAWRKKVARGVSIARQREVREGRWRNPALDEEARRKLSRPRRHGDNLVLHSAIEKLGAGMSVFDLALEEQEEHRVYQRRLRQARIDDVRAYYRQHYRKRMSTEEGRAKEREKWQRQRERLAQGEPNRQLAEARRKVGLSQRALAQAVGVSPSLVSKWERFGVLPGSDTVRGQVEQLLGEVW